MSGTEIDMVNSASGTDGFPGNNEEVYEVIGDEYRAILEADAAIPLEEELLEIEDSGVLDELVQEVGGKEGGLLSEEETRKLFAKIESGGAAAGDAIAEIYERNQGLVKSIVGRYRRKDAWLSHDDLVLEGNIGLLTAIRRFDTDGTTKFSTFSYGTIRGRVLRAQEKDPRVIKPFSKITKELLALMDDFYAAHNREHSSEKELLDFAKDIKDDSGKPVWDLERLKRAAMKLRQSRPASSLDAPLNGDDEDDDDGGNSTTPGDLQPGSPGKGDGSEEGDKKRAEEIEKAIEEAGLDCDIAFLLKSFLADPYGIHENAEVARRFRNPTADRIDELIVENLQDEELQAALKEKGLLQG